MTSRKHNGKCAEFNEIHHQVEKGFSGKQHTHGYGDRLIRHININRNGNCRSWCSSANAQVS